MSVACVRAVLNYPLEDIGFKAVLVALADFANKDHEAWPSIRTICEKSGAGRSTAQRKLRMAEEMGLITSSQRYDLSTQYTFAEDFVERYYHEPERRKEGFHQSRKEISPEPSLFGKDELPVRGPHSGAPPRPAAVDPRPAAGTPRPAAGPKPLEEPLEEPLDSLAVASATAPEESLPDFVVRRWNEMAKEFPTMASSRKLEPAAKKRIIIRADAARNDGETGFDVWNSIFQAFERSRFLRGLAPPGPGRTKAFRPNLIWLLKAENFAKVINGAYDEQIDSSGRDIRGNRNTGPTATAVSRARERFSSGRQLGQ